MKVALIMGSDSDWPRLEGAKELLEEFGVAVEVRVLSAHRTPEACAEYVRKAEEEGTQIFIAAAGLAAHLPGVVASYTRRPVIGVPIAAGPLQGQDALYSMVQMPPGVPVATVGIDNSRNAAFLALSILALKEPKLDIVLAEFRQKQKENSLARDKQLQARLISGKEVIGSITR